MEFITLENKDKVNLIKDVVIYPLKVNADSSGILVETLRKDWSVVYGEGREFAMQYFSVTKAGVARDEDVWHYHPTKQEDRFLVAYGDIVVAIADNREDSSTNGVLNLFHMRSSVQPYMLLIPKRTLHGFMVVSKDSAVLLNFPTTLYDEKEEGRISYKDANIKLSDGSVFNWEVVRKVFFDSNV